MATLLITGARLGHLLGYRTMFLAGVAVFGAASLVCGLAGDPIVLVGARVIQGVGGALAFPQVLTTIQAYFDEGAEPTRALGSYSIALAGGSRATTGPLALATFMPSRCARITWPRTRRPWPAR